MPQQLSLAANLVTQTLVFGHLQIVFEDSSGDLFENETTSPGFPYFFGNWAFPVFGRSHDNTANTPGYGNPQRYAIVPMDLRPAQTAEHVWELMSQIHASLSTGGHGLDYDIGQNSNSYVTSVLSVVGIDVAGYLPAVTPPDVEGFPGAATNIFLGAKTGGLFSGYDTPIPLTLAGTAGHDYIQTGIGNDDLGGAAGNDEIRASYGDDILNGGRGADELHGNAGQDLLLGGAQDDKLKGGRGRDTLEGNRGEDRVFGGNGQDRLEGGMHDDLLIGGTGSDTLRGGTGDDTLEGGVGNDRLIGGKDDDTFVFADNEGDDTITDFDAQNDEEKIDLSGITAITDLADLTNPANPHMTQVGTDVVIDDFDGHTITLLDVTLDELDSGDFIFA